MYMKGRTNTRSGSITRWHWCETLEGPPRPYRHSRPAGASIFELRSRDPRKPLQVEIRYRGGAEGEWRIRARDWEWRFPGTLSVVDVMNWINRCDS